jgi:hypothetical protein
LLSPEPRPTTEIVTPGITTGELAEADQTTNKGLTGTHQTTVENHSMATSPADIRLKSIDSMVLVGVVVAVLVLVVVASSVVVAVALKFSRQRKPSAEDGIHHSCSREDVFQSHPVLVDEVVRDRDRPSGSSWSEFESGAQSNGSPSTISTEIEAVTDRTGRDRRSRSGSTFDDQVTELPYSDILNSHVTII